MHGIQPGRHSQTPHRNRTKLLGGVREYKGIFPCWPRKTFVGKIAFSARRTRFFFSLSFSLMVFFTGRFRATAEIPERALGSHEATSASETRECSVRGAPEVDYAYVTQTGSGNSFFFRSLRFLGNFGRHCRARISTTQLKLCRTL